MTTTTIQKWGNSYAVRLPKAAVEKLKLGVGQAVAVTEGKDRTLSISAVPQEKMNLSHLVSLITPQNRHEPTEWGKAVGKEAW